MTSHSKLFNVLKSTGLSVDYMSPRKGKIAKLPFIVYSRGDDATLIADNERFCGLTEFRVSLYQERRDAKCEAKVEAALASLGPFHRETDTWIDRENCQLTVYTIELLD